MRKVGSSKEKLRKKVMSATIASLKNMCRLELSDSEYVDLAIGSTGLEELIEQAEAGDKDAETKARHLATFCLIDDDFVPLREYAERLIERQNKGLPDPNRPGGGRPPRPYREKLWIAHSIHKAKQSKSQNEACSAVVEILSKESRDGEEAISPEQVRKIYQEAKRDIEALYKVVRNKKAASVPIRCAD